MAKMLNFFCKSSIVVLFMTGCGTAPRPAATIDQPASASATPASATACVRPAAPTISETEGPFFKANSPERATLWEPGMAGTKLVLSGYVLTTDCQPVAHALLDFWQANATGQYDNSGYSLRGHQYTDTAGRYELTTVIPGLYPGRTEHIHVKVQAPNGPVLTTQLFFPGVAYNDSDGIFDRSLLIVLQDNAGGATGSYNFVVSAH